MTAAAVCCLIAGSSPAFGNDRQAEDHLVDAAIAYREKAFKKAFRHLSAARRAVESDGLSAKIERQVAILYVARRRVQAGFRAFRRALALDPSLQLDQDLGWDVRSVFDCARRDDSDAELSDRLRPDGRGGWQCTPRESLAAAAPPAPPKRSPPSDARLVSPPAAAPSPPPTTLSVVGGVGIGLIALGAGVGGSLFAWQTAAAQDSGDESQRLRDLIADADAPDVPTETLIAAVNTAENNRADQQRNAALAAGIGAGVAGVGFVLLILDLVDERSPSDALAHRDVQFGFGSMRVTF